MIEIILFWIGITMCMISPITLVTYIYWQNKKEKEAIANITLPSAPRKPGYERVAARSFKGDAVWVLMKTEEFELNVSKGRRLYYLDGKITWKENVPIEL